MDGIRLGRSEPFRESFCRRKPVPERLKSTAVNSAKLHLQCVQKSKQEQKPAEAPSQPNEKVALVPRACDLPQISDSVLKQHSFRNFDPFVLGDTRMLDSSFKAGLSKRQWRVYTEGLQ